MTAPLVSILIPSFNAETHLAQCLESALNQTYPKIEIVIVDDGSTDGSLALARSFEHRGVAVIPQGNRGQPAALNKAFAAAKGDYIQYLDADDVLHPEKVAKQVERLRQAGRLVMASGAWSRFQKNLSEANFIPEPVWRDMDGVSWLVTSWLGGGMMPTFAYLVPRELVERAGPFNEQLSVLNDLDFFSKVMLDAAEILFCSEARGYYRTLPMTMSGRRDRAALVSAFTAIEASSGRLLRRCNSVPASKACATQFQRFIYDAYPFAPDLVVAAERRVAELGGSDLKLHGGRAFKMLARCFGWKFGRRCQLAYRELAQASPAKPRASLSANR